MEYHAADDEVPSAESWMFCRLILFSIFSFQSKFESCRIDRNSVLNQDYKIESSVPVVLRLVCHLIQFDFDLSEHPLHLL